MKQKSPSRPASGDSSSTDSVAGRRRAWHSRFAGALGRSTTVLSVIAVLVAYAWFASGGSFEFRRTSWESWMYPSLAEGFFRGTLHMAHTPSAELMASPFPWDPAIRGNAPFLWDASYFNGRYYLYFSPLPVVLFYMPYRHVAMGYPPDSLVALFFASWALIASVAFARRAMRRNVRPNLPMWFWTLLIGFGSATPFLLMDIRIYEVAIFAGAAMTAMWAWALVRFFEMPTPLRALWLGVWLALAIAARPNLGVLLVVTAIAILTTTKEWRDRSRVTAAALVPLAIVGGAMMAYNAARFHDPLEFGTTYQLTAVPMQEHSVCSLCSLPELSRFVNNAIHYVFWAPVVRPQFPFVDLQYTSLKGNLVAPLGIEEVVGVAALVPLTLLGAFFAGLLVLKKQPTDSSGRAAIYVTSSAWLILFALSTCWWVVTRYSLDFMYLMTAASVICIERGLSLLKDLDIRMLPLRVAIVLLACYSIIIGFLLGFVGQGDAFQRLHPAVYQKIVDWLA